MTPTSLTPTDGRLLVDAFDNIFGEQTTIHLVDSTFINGRILTCRFRRVLSDRYCPDLGWLRCMHSQDFQFASLEIYNSQADASEQHALFASPKLINAVWFEPRQYYTTGNRFRAIFFEDRIDKKGEAANARMLSMLIPFDLRK